LYLTKLEMRGFKTFADKTALEFQPGITAIVGPNGVGKSNITDAILWVLGEQSNKALRAEAAQDVIFAGTEGRRPLGLSEVALTLDNADGSLATEFSEVVVGRRLFRNGESNYLLNKANVRLRDIRDLFVDTGLGPQAYSVVGQGELDAILSIRSEDRRALIEEVAGVRKYRLRRTEAERKLESTQANLTRITDILHELSSQREPLEQEAEKARQYNELAGEVQAFELQLLAVDYRRRGERQGKLLNEAENLQADLVGTRTQVSQLDAEHEQLGLRIAKLSDELDKLRDEATAAERKADQQRQAEALGDERLHSIGERRQQLVTLQEHAQKRGEELQRRGQTVAEERKQVDKKANAAQQKVEKLQAQLASLQQRHQEVASKLETAEQRRRELLEAANALENEATALAGLEAELVEREARLQGQAEGLGKRQKQVEAELATARGETERTEAKLTATSQKLAAARDRQAEVTRLLREHREKRGILDSAVAAGEERCGMLRELAHAHEGYAEGPKAVLEAGQGGQLKGVFGAVADYLDVPARLELAIEAGLGEELQWILVEDNDAAQAAIEYLRQNKLGRATFIPIGAIDATPAGTPATVAVGREGVVGLASRLVKYPRKFATIFEHLLGNLIMVKDLTAALAVRTALHTQARIVTLQGEVVGRQGQISGGTVNGGVARALGRRRQLEEIEGVLAELRSHLARMWEVEERLEQQGHEAAESMAEAEQAVSELQATSAKLRGNLAHLGDQARALRAASEELAEDRAQLAEKLRANRQRRAEAERECKGLRHEAGQVDKELKSLHREAVPEESLDEARSALTEAQVQRAELAEKQRSTTAAESQFQVEQERVAGEVVSIEQELESLQAEEQQVRQSMGQDAGEVEALDQQAQALRDQVAERSEELSQLRETSVQLDTSRRELSRMSDEQSERVHRIELSLAREESQLEFITQQLADLYELTPEQALERLPDDFKEMQTRKRANELREAIRKLGPVNLSAIDEVERLSSREEFLQAQVEDLQKAQDDLLAVIDEIDEAANEAFMVSFEQVQVAFGELFEELFEGGATQLVLTNPEAPLEGGVDVIVQVPGKRQQNLLLLSGGERALTALALLFAMIKVKPSPFCVMDEIDAALDANNTERFTKMLKDFAQRSQFIIITHNPQTMVIADAHWGVTMQEPGVSMILPLELEEAQSAAEEISREEGRSGGTGGVPIGATRVLPTRD